MFIFIVKVKIYIEWSSSLKDKRKIRYTLRDRLKSRYNISVKEIDSQNSIKTLGLGIAGVALTEKEATDTVFKIEEFILDSTEAEVSEFIYDIQKV